MSDARGSFWGVSIGLRGKSGVFLTLADSDLSPVLLDPVPWLTTNSLDSPGVSSRAILAGHIVPNPSFPLASYAAVFACSVIRQRLLRKSVRTDFAGFFALPVQGHRQSGCQFAGQGRKGC